MLGGRALSAWFRFDHDQDASSSDEGEEGKVRGGRERAWLEGTRRLRVSRDCKGRGKPYERIN